MNKRIKIALLLLIITAVAHVYGDQPNFPANRLVFSTSPVEEIENEIGDRLAMDDGLANEMDNDSPVIADSPITTNVPVVMPEVMDRAVPTMRHSPIFDRVRTGGLPNENEGRHVFPENQTRMIDGLPQFYNFTAVMQNIQRHNAVLQNSPASVASPFSTASDVSTIRSIDMDDFNLDDFNLDD